MKTLNSFKMEHNTHNDGMGGISILVGFVLAFTNHIFGWLGNVHFTANWDGWFQALILGMVGSTATFFTNKFWKFLEKKFKKKKE